MNPTQAEGDGAHPCPEEIDAVMLAARVFVAVTAQSVASVEDQVTLPQLRILVMIASRGPWWLIPWESEYGRRGAAALDLVFRMIGLRPSPLSLCI